jgi:tetratricopeptide (TPR) repeat protein
MAQLGPSSAREEEFQRLVDDVQRALHFGQVKQAEAGARRLVELAPESTTAHELLGDVLSTLHQTGVARTEYHRALEIEPANADAERKYAELSLQEGQRHWPAEAILAGDDGRFRGAAHKSPAGAALRSVLFPGLGQLYNGDFELGVGLAVVGLGLLMGVLAAFLGPYAEAILGSMMHKAVKAGPGVWGWLSLIGYVAVYIYSIYEAYHTGKTRHK